MHAIKVLSLLCMLPLYLAQNVSAQTFNPFEQDTLVHCGTPPLRLDAGADFARYQWHSGSNTRITEVTASGWQHVTVSDQDGNTFTDSVYVAMIPYTLNGFTTSRPEKEWAFIPVPEQPLRISSGVIFEGAGQFSYGASSTWISDAHGTIDSVSFFLESFAPADTFYPAGELLIYGYGGNPVLAGAKWRFPAAGGLVTVPVRFEVKAHYRYYFTFIKLHEAPAPPYGNYAYLRAGKPPADSANTQAMVWLQLHGRTYQRNQPGHEYHACYPQAIDLQVSIAGDHTIQWSSGHTTDAIRVMPEHPSLYPFTLTQNGFTCRDTARATVFRVPYNPFPQDSLLFCDARAMSFNARQGGYDYYYWRGGKGSLMGEGHIQKSGWLVATAEGVQNGLGCLSSDSIYVRLLGDSIRYYRFTGNGLFSDAANWDYDSSAGFRGKPPAVLQNTDRILIDTRDTCILDVDITVFECGNIQVLNNSQLILQRQLRITR